MKKILKNLNVLKLYPNDVINNYPNKEISYFSFNKEIRELYKKADLIIYYENINNVRIIKDRFFI